MSDYLVGVVTTINGQSDMLIQSVNGTMETDEYEAKDEGGNTAAHQLINHRLKLSIEAIIPDAHAVPVPGSVISVPGVTLPTVAADGTVSGEFKIDPEVSTLTDFKVTGTPQLSQSNTDYKKYSLEATRWLVNGIPAAAGSSGSGSAQQ